jgi:hypothetical protein
MPELDDHFYRVQGRLNALENLLIALVVNRAVLTSDPYSWIMKWVEQNRHEKPPEVVGTNPYGADLSRIAVEIHKAMNEISDQVERQGQIFRPAGSKQ